MNEKSNPMPMMYKTIPAVAELNKVPGFDPLKFLRHKVSRKTNEEMLQLELPYQKLWFRLRHPQGRMKLTTLRITEQLAIIGKPVTSEKPVLFLESIYTFGLNDIEKEEVMKLAVSLTTQKAAELGVVAVLARRYLGCYERDEYVLAPFYVYISKSKNGWQYLDSLGGAAYTSAKEEYVEHPFLVMQTAMHQAEANSRNEVYYE